MKIGHVSLFYRPVTGGQETYIENLKQVLERLGHRNTVYQPLPLKYSIDRNGVNGVPTLPLLPRVNPNLNWYFFNLCLRLKRRAIAEEDLLIVHYAFHYPAVKYHPKIITVSHGIEWSVPPTTRDDRLRASRAIETFDRCTIVANDTDYLRHCGVKITPGTGAFEEIQPGKWFIPNCVDTGLFRKTTPDGRLQKLNAILVPRNIYFERGLHLAIDAFARLVKAGYDRYKLVIVGKIVDRRYYARLCKAIEQYNIGRMVHFWEHVPWAEMPHIYSSSLCTLIPSISSEGTSLSALESMACGTPVVSTKVGGLQDLPTLQCAPEVMAIRDALIRMLSARDAYAAQQEEAVRSLFHLEKWSRAWEQVIAETMQ